MLTKPGAPRSAPGRLLFGAGSGGGEAVGIGAGLDDVAAEGEALSTLSYRRSRNSPTKPPKANTTPRPYSASPDDEPTSSSPCSATEPSTNPGPPPQADPHRARRTPGSPIRRDSRSRQGDYRFRPAGQRLLHDAGGPYRRSRCEPHPVESPSVEQLANVLPVTTDRFHPLARGDARTR